MADHPDFIEKLRAAANQGINYNPDLEDLVVGLMPFAIQQRKCPTLPTASLESVLPW